MKGIFTSIILLVPALFPPMVQAQGLDSPTDGYARVYFFHFLAPPTGRYAVKLYADQLSIGFVESSSTYGFDLEPGEHLLWAKAASQKWFLKADLEAGRTYYVHLWIRGVGWNPLLKPTLYPAGPKTKKGKKILKKIESRLAKEKFIVARTWSAVEVAMRTESDKSLIQEIMEIWNTEWSDEKRWQTLAKDDYVR